MTPEQKGLVAGACMILIFLTAVVALTSYIFYQDGYQDAKLECYARD